MTLKNGTRFSVTQLGLEMGCVLSSFSCLPLRGPTVCVAHQAPLSMGFSKQEHWSGLPCPPPGDLPNPGMEPRSPALQADSLQQSRPSYDISNYTE